MLPNQLLRADSPTIRASLYHAVFVGAVVVLKSATNALYLAHAPPEGLASLYIAVAIGVAIFTVLLAGPLGRWSPRRLLDRTAWALGAVVVPLALFAPHAAVAPLYVAAELYATCLSVLFWSTIGGWFDARSARRAFGLVSAGGMAGAMTSGVLTGPLAAALGAPAAAAIGALLPVAALPLLGADRSAAPALPAPSLGTGASYLVGQGYPRLLAALAVTSAALGACVDYVFRVEAAKRLGELELASLFGWLNAAVGAGAIAYQVVFTPRLLERAGLFVFLATIPALLAGLAGAAAATGSFSIVVALKGIEMAGSYSIQQAGTQLLYNPVPRVFRPAVRAFVDGLVKKAGLAIAGLGLVVLLQAWPAAISPWLIVGLAVLALALLRPLRRGYLTGLEDRIRGARAAVVVPAVDVVDRSTRAVLLRALASPAGSEARAALSLLARDPSFPREEYLPALLTHPDEATRLMALRLVPEQATPRIEQALLGILSLDARRPRAAAVRALARCRPDRAAEVLAPLLDDPDPGVVCAVIGSLHDHPGTGEAARARLARMIEGRAAASAAERRELARLLGELPLEHALAHLPAQFEDPDPSVRKVAFASAAEVFSRVAQSGSIDEALPLVEAVRARLAVRDDRDDAREALSRLGDRIVPLLRESLDDRRLPLAVRIEIPRLLRSIGTAAAAEALLFSNIRDHPSLRYRTIECLFRLRREHPEVPIDRARTDEACLRRLGGFAHYRPLCFELAALAGTAPRSRAWEVLAHALSDRLIQNLQTALALLGLHRGAERMSRAARLLESAERRALAGAPPAEVQAMRADAVELLDVALQGDPIRADAMAVLEAPPPVLASVVPRWPDATTAARALAASADPLVAGLARLALRSWKASEDALAARADEVSDPTDFEEVPTMDEELLNRILALEQVDLFAGLLVDEVAAIAGITEERRAGPGEVLYREGDRGDSMMVILRGRVKLSRGGRPFMDLGPGQSLGQVSFLDGGPRPTTAVVGEEPGGAELLVVPGDLFMDLVTDRPGLARGLFAVLAKRLRTLIDLTGPAAR